MALLSEDGSAAKMDNQTQHAKRAAATAALSTKSQPTAAINPQSSIPTATAAAARTAGGHSTTAICHSEASKGPHPVRLTKLRPNNDPEAFLKTFE